MTPSRRFAGLLKDCPEQLLKLLRAPGPYFGFINISDL